MPTLAKFYGIKVMMYWGSEHNPPHVHIVYGEYDALMNIETGKVTGKFPKHGKALAWEWVQKNQKALLKIWNTKTLCKLKSLN